MLFCRDLVRNWKPKRPFPPPPSTVNIINGARSSKYNVSYKYIRICHYHNMWSIHPMGLTTICMMSENEFSQVGQGKSWPSLQLTIIKLSAKVFSSSISLVWWDETFLFEVSQGFCNNVTCLPYLTYRYTYIHCYILIFGLREKQCCLRTLLVFFHFLYHINPILDGQYHYSYTWHINLIKKTSPKNVAVKALAFNLLPYFHQDWWKQSFSNATQSN